MTDPRDQRPGAGDEPRNQAQPAQPAPAPDETAAGSLEETDGADLDVTMASGPPPTVASGTPATVASGAAASGAPATVAAGPSATAPSGSPATATESAQAGAVGGGPAQGLLGGRFEVLEPIGEGGMGQVFLVRDRQIENRRVALKLIKEGLSSQPRFRNAFFTEIRSAQEFVSQHAVQIRDCGELPGGQLFLTMDFVEGESLSSLLKREKSLMPRHALEIARQVLVGLASGHEKGYVHRDVKPGNVMLAARTPKTGDNPHGVKVGLLDFGIAGLGTEFKEGRGPGTPFYMSPEQVQGQPLDSRSDLFAVGVMLFEMISGTRPFDGRTVDEVTTSVLETDPTPLVQQLDGVKKPVKKLLRKALHKSREKRYASAADFIQAIESCTAFRAREGAPSWVGGLATLTTTASLVLGFLLLDARNSQVLGKMQEDQGVSNLELRLETAQADKKRFEADAERLKSLNSTLEAGGKQKDRQIEVLGERVATLSEQLKAAEGRESKANQALELARTEKSDANVDMLSARVDKLSQNVRLVGLLERLVEFLPIDFSLRATQRQNLASAFDELLADIVEGEGGLTRAPKLAERAGLGEIDPDAIGLPYVQRVEELACKIGEWSHRGGEQVGELKEGKFTELQGLVDELGSLHDEKNLGTFIEDGSRAPEERTYKFGGDQYAGGWLAYVPRTREELLSALAGDMIGLDDLGQQRPDAEPGLTQTIEEVDRKLAPEGAPQGSGSTGDAGPASASATVDDETDLTPDPRLDRIRRQLQEYLNKSGDDGLKGLHDAFYGASHDEAKAQERAGELIAALESMKAALDREKAGLDELVNQRLDRITGEQDPEERIRLIVSFLGDFQQSGVDKLGEIIPDLLREIEEGVVDEEHRDLVGKKVREIPGGLKALEEKLNALESADDDVTAWLVETRWLILARDHHTGSLEDEYKELHGDELDGHTFESGRPWRDLVVFQLRAKDGADDLMRREGTRVYATRRKGEGPSDELTWTRWDVELDGTEFLLKQSIHGSSGAKLRNTFAPTSLGTEGQRIDSLRWVSGPVHDLESPLRKSGQVRFEGFTFNVDDRSRFEDLEEGPLARLREQMIPADHLDREQGSLQCLRVELENGAHLLIHPTLGVVVYETKTQRHELVHLEF